MRIILALILMISMSAITACDYIFASEWKYKVTVEVETPEGIKSGSAVRQIKALLNSKLFPVTQAVDYDVIGEAVVVDLGDKGKLFYLIYDGDVEMVQAAFPYPNPNSKEGIKFYRDLKLGSKINIKNINFRNMVRFSDINDPKSVQQIYGTQFDIKKQDDVRVDNFEKVYGKGYRLNAIIIEITNEPVTWGVVDNYLPKNLKTNFKEWWEPLSSEKKMELIKFYQFKMGEH